MDAIRERYERTHKRILAWLPVEQYRLVDEKLAEVRARDMVQMPDGSWKEGAKITKTDLLQMAIHGLLKKRT